MRLSFGRSESRHVTVDLLSAYLDGQITSTERTQIEAHLQGCAECRSELASLRNTVAMLKAMPRVAVPRAFTLSEAKAGIRQAPARPAWFGGALRGLGAVTALALVALVATTALRNPSWTPGQAIARNPTAPAAAARSAAPVDTAEPQAAAAAPAPVITVPVEQAVAAADATLASEAAQPEAASAPADSAALAEPAPAAKAAPELSTDEPGVMALAPQNTPDPGVLGLGRGGGAGAAAVLPAEVLTPEPLPPTAQAREVLPAGARLVYADTKGLWALDRASGLRQLAAAEGLNMPLLSADQAWVVYRVWQQDFMALWVVGWEGGAPRLLLDERGLPKDGLDADHVERRINDVRWAPGEPELALNLVAVPSPSAPSALPKLELWSLGLETGALRYVADLERAYRPFYSPDGSQFATLQYGTDTDPQGRLVLTSADGSNRRAALQFAAGPGKPSYDTQVSWLPDGSALLLALPDADTLQPGSLNGTTLYRISNEGSARVIGRVDAFQAAWSPDGARLAFTRVTADDMVDGELFLANGDGTSAQRYTAWKNGAFLGWAPDGTHFLYQNSYDTYLGALGQAPQRLGTSVSFVNPRWVSDTQFVSQHDIGTEWALTLRGTDGAAYSLLTLPREAMLDAAHR